MPAQTSIFKDLTNREIDERCNLHFKRKHHVTDGLLSRLGVMYELEVSLRDELLVVDWAFDVQGHRGCVNCLHWNKKGK